MAATKRPPYNARLQDWLPTVGGLIAVAVWSVIPYFPNGTSLMVNLTFYCIILVATGAASVLSLRSSRRHHLPLWLVGVNISWLVLSIVALALKIFTIIAVAYLLQHS